MNRVSSLRSPATARIVAVTLLWITRTLASLLVACPLLFAITGSGLVSGPDRDAPLFRPGALILLELARSAAPLLGAGLKISLLLWVVCATLELVPLGAALDLLQSQEADAFSTRTLRGFRLFPRFFALSGITLLGQAALILAASLLEGGLSAALQGRDERVLTLTPGLVFGAALLCCAWLGAVLDIARGAVVRHDISARAALTEALGVLREAPLSVLFGSYPSAAGSLFAWLGAGWILTQLDLSSPTTRTLVLAFVVHQGAVLFSLALRVRWLDRALALGAAAPSARD